MKKRRGSTAAPTQDPWITSRTLYHWATRDPWTFLWKYFKIWPAVPEEKIFKNCLKIPFGCNGNQIFFMNQILWTILKRTSKKTFLSSLVLTGQAVWEGKMFNEIVNDAAGPSLKLPLHMLYSGKQKIWGPWWPWIAHLSHFPHKMNSSFFVLIVPTCDPKVGPVLTPGASYEQLREEFWILPFLFLCSNLWPPRAGSVLTPEESYEQNW